MTKEKAVGNYDLELSVTRKRDEQGNHLGWEAKQVKCTEQDRSVGDTLSETLRQDARQMLVESKFQDALVQFADKGPTRPVILWVGLERVFRRGRVKRGPGKGRMRTLRRYDRYKDPKQAEYFKKMIEPRPGDFEGCTIAPPNERSSGLDALFASLKGTEDESENL